MAVVKNKDMDWKSYLRKLAESSSKLTDIDRIEFSGYLLRRDLENEDAKIIINNIFSVYQYDIGDMIADFLIAESPDTTKYLHTSLKNSVVDYYTQQINELIADEMKIIQEELSNENSKEEYYNDTEDFC